MVGNLGNDPSEHKCVGFTVQTVSLTVYLPKIVELTKENGGGVGIEAESYI